MKLLIISVLGATMSLAAPRNVFDDAELQPLMDRIEKNADRFDSALASALDGSDLNGSDYEDRLNSWADFFEDEVDNMAAKFKDKDSVEFGQHMNNAMMAATAINRAMLGRQFDTLSQAHWKSLRDDLNMLGRAFSIAPLPNVTIAMLVPATGEMLTRGDVRQVMEQLEASTDRFTDKFDDAWYTSIAGRQRAFFKQAADDLEDISDDMLDEYRDEDARAFQMKLEHALVIAAGMNRMILASTLSDTPAAEWRAVREQLNTLAKVFGYPALPTTMDRVTISSR